MIEEEALTVLVVDDEEPARRDLLRMLRKVGGVEIAGEAADGPEAVKMIKKLCPDLVLLDIQMPGLDGFQVIGKLSGRGGLPSIIFITAYDEYALKAFEVHAVDYILKPVEEKRLVRAIERARRVRRGIEGGPDIEALLRTMGVSAQRLALKRGEALIMVDVEDVLYATVSSGEVRVVMRDFEGASSFRSLDEFQRELPAGCFFRVHRSYVVNMRQIHEITPWFSGGYRVRMGGGDGPVLPLSRSQARELRKILKW